MDVTGVASFQFACQREMHFLKLDSQNRRERHLGPGEFDEASYLAFHPDVAQAVVEGRYRSGRQHWESCGRAEGRAPSLPGDFDELLYLDLNPDVMRAVLSGSMPSGAHHWMRLGMAEGRMYRPVSPEHPDWDEVRYLRLNEDAMQGIRAGGFASGYDHWEPFWPL
ncbi:MAG: hypothetical protein WDO73_32260 [Ignavibacteriota bacterium]